MAEKIAGARKPRADAERNRQRLLDIAKRAFAEKGMSASLEDIARAAGVGIGTLYRHFPTRNALVHQLYSTEGSQLAKAAERLSKESPPLEAVREWLFLFIDFLVHKKILAEVLDSTIDSERLRALSAAPLIDALATLLERAKRSGDNALKVEPLDMLCAIAGVARFGSEVGWESSARRLVDVMVAGLRNQPVKAKRVSSAYVRRAPGRGR